jgi:tetratricopeptide (TPR) repeat protein
MRNTNSLTWPHFAFRAVGALLLVFAFDASAQLGGAGASVPAAASTPPTGVPPGTGNPAGAVAAPAPPVGFVVVQATYLEQMAAASKASVDAVSLTAQSAIGAAKDKEEWMVRVLQTVGIVFSAIALVLTYFGITKYSEIRGYLSQIKAASKKAQKASEAADQHAAAVEKTKVELMALQSTIATGLAHAQATVNDLAERIGEIEQFFAGIHSQRLVMDSLRISDQKVEDAKAALDDALALYVVAQKLKNERIQSFMAASLALLYMYAEQWKEACEFGLKSIECNPRHWSDRPYNVACIFALKYQKEGIPEDREQAVKMLKMYFGRKDAQKVSETEIQEALADADLAIIRDEIVAMMQPPEGDPR